MALTALTADGWLVARVEQPWRVAGRRIATPPAQLDTAWLAVLHRLTTGRGRLPVPLVVGGRSAGARVACRTAEAVGAAAVLALSFPLHPPGRPDKSRADEARLVLDAGLPLAVVQGERDALRRTAGGPRRAGGAGRRQARRAARTRSPRTRPTCVQEVRGWLATLRPYRPEPGGRRRATPGMPGRAAVLNGVILKRRRRMCVFDCRTGPRDRPTPAQARLGKWPSPPRH